MIWVPAARSPRRSLERGHVTIRLLLGDFVCFMWGMCPLQWLMWYQFQSIPINSNHVFRFCVVCLATFRLVCWVSVGMFFFSYMEHLYFVVFAVYIVYGEKMYDHYYFLCCKFVNIKNTWQCGINSVINIVFLLSLPWKMQRLVTITILLTYQYHDSHLII